MIWFFAFMEVQSGRFISVFWNFWNADWSEIIKFLREKVTRFTYVSFNCAHALYEAYSFEIWLIGTKHTKYISMIHHLLHYKRVADYQGSVNSSANCSFVKCNSFRNKGLFWNFKDRVSSRQPQTYICGNYRDISWRVKFEKIPSRTMNLKQLTVRSFLG